MKNAIITTLRKLNMELNERNITYDAPDNPDGYNQYAELDGVYDWGFTVLTHCDVLDPTITFYDWEYQSIVSLYLDDETKYQLSGGYLKVTESGTFNNKVHKFFINLNNGASIHVSDIKCIGYMPNVKLYEDIRFYALHDGRIFYKADGAILRQLLNVTIDDLMRQGFTLIEPEHYDTNVNVLNDMVVRM